jgi:transposase
MEIISIGVDVSKGRADVAIINQSGTMFAGSGGYDDTRSGHNLLSKVLQEIRERHPLVRFVAGVEATGGYERNWVGFFKGEQKKGLPVVLHRLNPLAVKRFLEADLHRKVDDSRAAQGIAKYLLERCRDVIPMEIPLDGRIVLYRNIRGLILNRVTMYERFQTLLPAVHPELVQYCRTEIPNWLLCVCERYPIIEKLARANKDALADIPHVGEERAASLKAAAQQSTASLHDPATAIAMELLVQEIQHLNEVIKRHQTKLIEMMADDPGVKLLDGIPCIGSWSAVAIRLEIGDVTRFRDVRQLIAWAGLDPREDESGDGVIKRGISHRGNAHLRAILFPLILSAKQYNPTIAAFIKRKENEGKPKKVAAVAGMAKLLRIAYAILVSGKPYDPEYELKRAKPNAQAQQAARSQTPASTRQTTATPDLRAPISAKEHRKRRTQIKAPAPQPIKCEVEPQMVQGADAPTASQQTPNLQQNPCPQPPKVSARGHQRSTPKRSP